MDDPNPLDTPSYLIKQIARELARQGEASLRPLGLGMAYLPVMTALKKGEASTQAELVRLLQVEQPSMAQMLARMERDGLVERKPDPGHGRNRIVSLTELGHARLPQARAALNDANLKGIEGFEPGEIAAFLDLLRRFNAGLRGLQFL